MDLFGPAGVRNARVAQLIDLLALQYGLLRRIGLKLKLALADRLRLLESYPDCDRSTEFPRACKVDARVLLRETQCAVQSDEYSPLLHDLRFRQDKLA